MTQFAEVRIVCGRRYNACGFNVDVDYFRRKVRFTPRICPNCNWGISYADARTYELNDDLDMDSDGPQKGMVFSISGRAAAEANQPAITAPTEPVGGS